MGSNRFDAMAEFVDDALVESENYISNELISEIIEILKKCNGKSKDNVSEYAQCYEEMIKILQKIVGDAQ